MGDMLGKAALIHEADKGRLIERDGVPFLVKNLRHPKAGDDDQHSTLELAQFEKVHLHHDSLFLQTKELGQPVRLSLPYYYLRDLCKCPRCVDPHSKQRSFRTNDIPKNIYPRHVKWDGKDLEIKWANDIPGSEKTHTSRWNYKYLKDPVIHTHEHDSKTTTTFHWNAALMQKLQHWISYDAYMNDDAQFTAAMRNLSRLGLIFIKNVPESREMVEKIATRMGPLRNSFYGSTWDVRSVPEAKNVAYTSQFLGFHMDLLYMNEPPGYQLLHCLENSCEGGESLFADSFRAARILETRFPAEYKTLTRRHLGYEYVHDDAIYHNTRPVVELDPQTRRVRHVNYSPPFQSALPDYDGKGGNDQLGYSLMKRALDLFTRFLEHKSSVFQLKLNPGECVIFANRRVVHARKKFNTANGSRWLAGAYVDEDAVLSRFAVSSKKNRVAWHKSDPNQSVCKARQDIDQERRAAMDEAAQRGCQADTEMTDIGEGVDLEDDGVVDPAEQPDRAETRG